jgi:hypothetical protein
MFNIDVNRHKLAAQPAFGLIGQCAAFIFFDAVFYAPGQYVSPGNKIDAVFIRYRIIQAQEFIYQRIF